LRYWSCRWDVGDWDSILGVTMASAVVSMERNEIKTSRVVLEGGAGAILIQTHGRFSGSAALTINPIVDTAHRAFPL
jgi:hypothetical protein